MQFCPFCILQILWDVTVSFIYFELQHVHLILPFLIDIVDGFKLDYFTL